ncbi:uncharacterized protein VICG_01206 [Vittaforma corneae ATCC 50505]|uniref:TAFII28-like protein domain-containing protein n=1 Tax=Vittaforma corneae (strain ATCC 50505) TaxID=993615 RepID=L2GN22_VITCO|nr:uncharacterized protein VICG_01206 [Vittaforma corneae ATCC 50505]ELA41702.1 hypothetical protein VICG_01206 [Vittaforma corneae ATCC 50505]
MSSEETDKNELELIEKESPKEVEKRDDTDKRENLESDSSLEESLFSQESLYKQVDDSEIKRAISEMNEADLQRNETFKRSKFPKSAIKKHISSIIGQAVNPNMIIAVAGLSKVFVGEMVEEAKKIQQEMNDDGALLPSHIHEAYRRLCRKIPNMKLNNKAPWA